MRCRCQQCLGEMEIDESIVEPLDARMCSMCTDKPVGEITDGIPVGQSLSYNEYQLKPH